MFGHSFYDSGTAILGRISDIKKEFQATHNLIGSIKNTEGFFSRLSKDKDTSDKWIRNSLGDIVTKKNIATYMPDLKDNKFSSILQNLVAIDTKVKTGSMSWQNYFNGLADGEKWQIEFVQNTDLQKSSLSDIKKAYNSARASAIAHNEALKAQTLSAKASQIALKGLSIAMNVLASIGISFLTSKILEIFTANERLLSSAKELGETFRQEQSSIEDYKNRIKDLQNTINDSSSSFENVSQARKDLMVIQDELIKKFGTEKETIEIITDAINNQSDALDSLTKKQYLQWKNNFNDKDFGTSAKDFFFSNNFADAFYKFTEFDLSGAWYALTRPTQSNTDKMVEGIQHAYYLLKKTGNNNLDSFIARTYNLGSDGSNFILRGNLNDIYETLLEIQELANDFSVSDLFETSVTKLANSMDKKLKSYKESYDIYVLYEKILDSSEDNPYDEQFQLINKAKEKFDETSILGDTDKIKETADEYAQTLQSAIDLAIDNRDQDVADYFKSIYPELQQMFGEWQFNLNFEPNTDGLKDRVTNALDVIDGALDGNDLFSVEDIESFNLNTATQEQIDAYGDLNNVAESYELTLKQLLALLQTMGLVQSESYQQLVDAFGQENIDKLLPDELNIAYSIENISDMTFNELCSEIQRLKILAKAHASFSDIFSLKDTEGTLTPLGKISEAIDTVQNAYKTLNDAIDEYNENGVFSIDTLQSVIALGDDWLDYLVDGEGNLTLDKEALEQLTQARLNDMRVQAINNLIDNVSKINDDASANEYLATTNYALAESYEEVAEKAMESARAKMEDAVAAGTLSQENMDAAINKATADIDKINKLFANTSIDAYSIMGGGGSGGSSSKSKFSETIDFFERRVEVLDDALSHLKSSLDNVTGSFAKNNLIDAELGVTEEKFNNYTDALAMYTQKANEAFSKIPADIASTVKDGAVSLTEFIGDSNEDVVEAIKEYESWTDKITDCTQELEELKTTIRQLELEKFNNIMDDFSNQFDLRGDSKDLISKQIDLLKEAGELIGESFYTSQIDQSKKQLELLENEKAQLVTQLSSAINSGRIQAGTEEWLEMVNALSDVDGSILDCQKSIEEFDNSLLELHTEIFNRIQEQFSNLDSEISNILDLFDEFEVSDDKGIWSKEGIAQLGLLAQQYELAQYQVQQYNNEIDELNKQYLAGRYSATEYADKLADLSSAQWDAVKSTESAKDSIMDLNETRIENQINGIEKEIDAYRELADAQIDALKASKDLHDYENSIAEKTKSITDLERQIAAMQNDTSAATIAKRKKLEEQLAEAKKDLEETEYDHSIEVQEDTLNKQYENYEKERNEEIDALRESLNDKETILAESFETVKENASVVGQEIATIATEHGITVSNALITSWQSGENAIASYGKVLSQSTSAFIQNIMGVEKEVWNLQAQANTTADSLAWMFSTKADNLVNELYMSYYAETTLADMTNALQQSLVNTLERGYDASGIVNSLNSIADAADRAKRKIDSLNDTPTVPDNTPQNVNPKYEVYTYNTGKVLETLDHVPTIEEIETIGSKYIGYNGISKLKVRETYASGTRNAKEGLRVVNEEGSELVLPKLPSGNYTVGNAGDQILTKAETDNIFEWAKFDPKNFTPVNMAEYMDNLRAMSIPPVLPNNVTNNNSINIHYDSMIAVNGDVNDTNHFIKQISTVAEQAITNAVKTAEKTRKYGMI